MFMANLKQIRVLYSTRTSGLKVINLHVKTSLKSTVALHQGNDIPYHQYMERWVCVPQRTDNSAAGLTTCQVLLLTTRHISS